MMNVKHHGGRLAMVTTLLTSTMMCATGNLQAADNKPTTAPVPQSWDAMMTIDQHAPITDLPMPANADQRQQAFAHRNDPAQIEALAHQLFSLWDLSERKTSREEITRRLEPMKAAALKLYQAKKYPESLDAFRAYFFAKVRLIFSDPKGLTSRDYEGRFSRELLTANYQDTAALLMDDAYQVATTKQTVRIGKPGLVRWDWQPSGPKLWENLRAGPFEYFNGPSAFDRLWWKFTDTGDAKYLKKYLAFMDDYVMNQTLQKNLSIGNIDLGKNGTDDAFNFIYNISEISRHLPADGSGYSSASLARMLVRILTVQLPQSLYYNREQSNNHSCGAIHDQLHLSDYLYDFNFSKVLERESRRQFEAYGTLFALPDGAMPGTHDGYAYHELRENMIFFNLLRDYDYPWVTPQLRREYSDRLVCRARYLLNIREPDGETMPIYKADRRNSSFDTLITMWLTRNLPEVWNDPASEAISTRIIHNQLSPDFMGTVLMPRNRPIASEGMGVSDGAQPPYTSISFPYTGEHLMRSGWDVATSSYGTFIERRAHGDNGGLFKDVKCCNTLEIGAFGQDLFDNGVGFAYNFLLSPVAVDGLQQFAINGKGPGARKGDNNEGLKPITPYRIHHSARYDVAEGLYDGVWADTIDHDPPFYDYKYRLEIKKKAVSGITHRRVVQFVKSHGVWIVIDEMTAPGKHSYMQQFFMPELQPKMPDGYKTDQFVVDEQARSLKSNAPGKVNLAMYYAGPASADLNIMPVIQKQRPAEVYTFYRADRHDEKNFLHLRSQWQAEGNSLLITVIQGISPNNGIGDPISSFTRGADGFSAKLASGAKLNFNAHLDSAKDAGFASRLTVTEADGSTSGMVLDNVSYEFSGNKDTAADRLPIYKPIRPLVITPNHNVFVDSVPISIAWPDKDVDVHYTLDGSDPTLSSPLYNDPVTLSGSAMFKARAFRKNLAQMPADQTSGVLMSRVYTAVFTRQDPIPADKVVEAKLKPGLRFKYYQAKWPLLLFDAPTLKPVKTGEARAIFDITANQGNKGAFAFN